MSSTMPCSAGARSPISYAASTAARPARRFPRSRAWTSASVVPLEHRVAALCEADDADRMVDRVVLRAAPGAEVERCEADRERSRDAVTYPSRGADDLAHDGRLRERAAGRDRRPARGSSARTPRAPSRRRRPPRRGGALRRRSIPRSESASSRADASRTSSVKSARAVAAHGVDAPRAPRARSRPPRPSGWSMSVSRHDDLAAGHRARARRITSASTRASSSVFMKAPSPTLTSRTIASRAGRELLRHDRARDQRDDVDGRRDVAQRVELLVGRDEVRGLADDRHADRRAPARRTPRS